MRQLNRFHFALQLISSPPTNVFGYYRGGLYACTKYINALNAPFFIYKRKIKNEDNTNTMDADKKNFV